MKTSTSTVATNKVAAVVPTTKSSTGGVSKELWGLSKVAKAVSRLSLGFGPHSTYDLPLKHKVSIGLESGNGGNKRQKQSSVQGWYSTIQLTDASNIESKYPVMFLDVGMYGASFEAKDFNTTLIATKKSAVMRQWQNTFSAIMAEHESLNVSQLPPQYRGFVSAMRSMGLSEVRVYSEGGAAANDDMTVKVTSATHLLANQHPAVDLSGEKVPFRQFLQTPGDLPCYELAAPASTTTTAALSDLEFALVGRKDVWDHDRCGFVQSPESSHTLSEGMDMLAILRPKSVRCNTSGSDQTGAELAWMLLGWVIDPNTVCYLRKSGVRAAYMLDATPGANSHIFGLTQQATGMLDEASLPHALTIAYNDTITTTQ